MEIQKVNGTSNVNFQKRCTCTPVGNTAPEPVKDGNKKLRNTLLCMASVAMAGIGIAYAIKQVRNGKGQEAVGEIVDEVKEKTTKVSDIAVAQKASRQVQSEVTNKKAQEITQDGIQQLHDGVSYGKVRKETTKNLNHEGKKIVKEGLSAENKAIKEVSAKAEEESKQISKEIQNKSNNLKNTAQGLRNAQDESVIQKYCDMDDEISEMKKLVSKQEEIAKANPTKQNMENVERARKQLESAQRYTDDFAQKGEQRLQVLDESAKKKAQNIQKTLDSTTPENLQAGQEKMAQNAQKTQKNAQKRQLEKMKSKPGFQRGYEKYKNYSKEQLIHVCNSPKTQEGERKAAQYLLSLCE